MNQIMLHHMEFMVTFNIFVYIIIIIIIIIIILRF